MEERDLLNLARLLCVTELNLIRASRAEPEDRPMLVTSCHEDAQRALDFWVKGRVTGLMFAKLAMEEACSRLESARKFVVEVRRTELIGLAVAKVLTALREVQTALAARQEREVANAGS
jgi:hypothetical protein